MIDTYRTIAGEGISNHRVLASKHLGFAIPIGSEQEAKTYIKQYKEKYFDANHVCFGYRVGREDLQRHSDDGEPSGTAGKPIAGAILSAGVTQVLVLVVRYFGGTKLGTGGLIQAYKTAAQLAIDNAGVLDKEWLMEVSIQCSYEKLPFVMGALKSLQAEKLSLEQTDQCHLHYAMSPSKSKEWLRICQDQEGIETVLSEFN
jgi:uncharacterized YigZ family protein